MMKLFNLCFLFFLYIIFNNACTKQENCARYFIIPTEIFPKKETYKTGDTIRIISKFHRNVPALNSQRKDIGTFDMGKIKWHPGTAIFRIDTIAPFALMSKVVEFCDFIQDTSYNYKSFILNTGSSGLEGEYNFENDTFNLQIKLVLKQSGIYWLKQASEISAARPERQDYPGKCGRNGFDVESEMNENLDNNIGLLESSPEPAYNPRILNNPEEFFYRYGSYCFRVIE